MFFKHKLYSIYQDSTKKKISPVLKRKMMQFMKYPKLTRSEKDFLSILYLMYSKLIWYISVKILKDRGLAEDAVQITFEKIIKKISLIRDFHDMDRVKQYIYVVAKNTALVMLRAKQKVVLLEEIPEAFDTSDPVAEEVINKITVEELKERVQAMNPIYGEAFFLRYFLELDYTEIADALSISVSAAQHRVSRAKALLRAGKDK